VGVQWESAGSQLGIGWESGWSPVGIGWEATGRPLGGHWEAAGNPLGVPAQLSIPVIAMGFSDGDFSYFLWEFFCNITCK
jgi:hypothetical protein